MISEKQIEQLCERLVNRIEQANLVFLEEIGKSIKQIGKLTPSRAQELVQILKYGTSYNDIIYKISQITNLNIKDIDKIFHAFAEKDRNFYKRFYEYRNVPFIPYQENYALKTQVQALANITKNELANFMNTRALGYSIKDLQGNTAFMGLRDTYNRVLDEAILNVRQGKQTFDEAMRSTLKQLGGSGLKTIDYKGKSMRLDSAIRMNMQGALRNLHNETQKIYGQEFGSDGIEISVHLNPAPDHAEVQGHQFSNEEFDKFQNDIDAKDYKGKLFTAKFEGKDRRAISEYNCYHYVFSIVLGVSQPQYSNEQLQSIINENNQKINIDGKEYTKYECTQLQRKFETAIRKQKDIQILAKASGNDNLILESQQNITQLTNKYREISKKAGLPTKADRLRVSGYRRTAIKISKEKQNNIIKPLNNINDIASYISKRKDDFTSLDVKDIQLKLNERNNFNNKPIIMEEKQFDDLPENEYLRYRTLENLDKDKYIKVYRGWGNKKYKEEFMYGENNYGTGGYIDGVGIYATSDDSKAFTFAHEDYDNFSEIAIPENLKITKVEDIRELHYKIYEDFNNNRDFYLNKYGKKVVNILDQMNENISSTAVLNNYDVIYDYDYDNWIILNRGKIIVKRVAIKK